jgi:serine/threonine protein kinase
MRCVGCWRTCCRRLQAVHEQGFLHRDIKPSNLYVRASDHRVILDRFRRGAGGGGPPQQKYDQLGHAGLFAAGAVHARNDRLRDPGPISTLWGRCCIAA